MAFLKPQNPMTKGSDYFYPLTTADQVIMDGGYRLDEIVGKTKKSTIMLYANGWSAEVPYCYSVAVQGLSDKVNMKMLPHFPENFEGKQAMKEETAKISFATREGNILTFECWDEVPTMDLPIDIEIEAMYPIKGASIEMNYSVVGGVEEPAKPAENMIWVNTDQNITDWVFSKNEPKNPEEGMIWFATGDNSNVSFFTLRMDKREFDEVYPISAKQYTGGAWVDKTAKSYQNGAWVNWIRYIFQSGSGAKVNLAPLKSANGTLNIGTDYIDVSYSTGTNGESGFYTEEPISIAGGSTLTVSAHCTERFQSDAYIGRFGLMKNKPTNVSVVQDFAYTTFIPVGSSKADYEITVGENDGGNYYFCYIGIAKIKIYDIKWR